VAASNRPNPVQMSAEPEQLELPLPKTKPLEDWKLSRQQFEGKADTVWRAEGAETLGGSDPDWMSGGLHFGTRQAAIDRGGGIAAFHNNKAEQSQKNAEKNPAQKSVHEARPVRLFSAKTTGRFSNTPEKAVKDVGNGMWPSMKTGKWYKNEVEDEGSVSGYVPRREGFLQTHKEIVLDAVQRGEHVHPAVRWEAENAPEYSDTVAPAEDYWDKKRKEAPENNGQGTFFPHVIHGGKHTYYMSQPEWDELHPPKKPSS